MVNAMATETRQGSISTRSVRTGLGFLCTGAFILFLAMLLTACTPASTEPGMLESGLATAGGKAPDFLLKDLAQQPVRLSDFRGTPVVLNFFASWCEPCLTELPMLQAAHLEAADRGYVVFGVATQDRRSAIEILAEDANLTFTIVIDGDNSVGRAYRVIGPPYTFFIAADGTVVDVIPGAMEQDILEHYLNKLLNMQNADAA